MTLLHSLDLLSTFVFALVGARVAADKGLDYGGIAFIAAIASVSGGTERIWTSSQGGSGNTDAWFIGLDGYSNAADGKEQYYPVFPIRSWAG